MQMELVLLLLLNIFPCDACGSKQYNQPSHLYVYKNLSTCQKSCPVRTQRLGFQYMCVCVCLSPLPEYRLENQSENRCSEGISVGQLWIMPMCSWPGRQEEGPDFHIYQALRDLTRWEIKENKDRCLSLIPPSSICDGKSQSWGKLKMVEILEII